MNDRHYILPVTEWSRGNQLHNGALHCYIESRDFNKEQDDHDVAVGLPIDLK